MTTKVNAVQECSAQLISYMPPTSTSHLVMKQLGQHPGTLRHLPQPSGLKAKRSFMDRSDALTRICLPVFVMVGFFTFPDGFAGDEEFAMATFCDLVILLDVVTLEPVGVATFSFIFCVTVATFCALVTLATFAEGGS